MCTAWLALDNRSRVCSWGPEASNDISVCLSVSQALLDAGVNVMESDDVQWRVLTRPADPSQGSSRRCHLAHRGDCPLLTLACITLATYKYSIS